MSYHYDFVQRTYKFRLYPNTSQYQKLDNTLGACRCVYNKMVEKIRKEGFQTKVDLNYFLTELKQQNDWLYSYHSKMLQMVSTQLEAAQKSMIRLAKKGHKTGQIKFASFGRYNTFVYNQSGFDIKDGYLYLSKLGRFKIIQHRQIPDDHAIKQIIISKSTAGKWHACVVLDVISIVPKISPDTAVGIDVGIKNFAYDSEGHATPNPLNLQKMLRPLRRIQRKIARRQKGSQNRKKAVRWYQIIHERIKNKRKDFLHKLSTVYAKRGLVFVEELQKLNMVQNRKLARPILDSGWSIFERFLGYKCMVVHVPARNTTIDCSRCGNMVPKGLAIRTHRCDVCGLVLDRDHNAAINILKKGLQIFAVPQELRELTPVEISKRSRKQEEATGLVR